MGSVVFAPPPAGTFHFDGPGAAVPLTASPVSTLRSVISTACPLLLSIRNVRVLAAKSSADVHSGTRFTFATGETTVVVVVVVVVEACSVVVVSPDVVVGADVVSGAVVGAAVVAGAVVGADVVGGAVVGATVVVSPDGGSGDVTANANRTSVSTTDTDIGITNVAATASKVICRRLCARRRSSRSTSGRGSRRVHDSYRLARTCATTDRGPAGR